jgi:hypothetical protein
MNISNTMNVSVYEMLDHINTLAGADLNSAIQFMQTSRGRPSIEAYLRFNFHPECVFLLPAGSPPFKRKTDVPDGYCMTDLKQENRRMRIFMDANMNISTMRREQLWIQILEGLFWKEADMLNKIKDHRLTDMFPNITAALVKQAYPSMLPADKVAEPLDDTPIDLTPEDDPTKISEEELIKESIEKFLKEEEVAKKLKTGTQTAQEMPVKERKKPGPKPKLKVAQTQEVPAESTPLRKKPGRKPKVQQ